MRLSLCWKIILITVLPIVALASGALWMANHSLSRQVQGAWRKVPHGFFR